MPTGNPYTSILEQKRLWESNQGNRQIQDQARATAQTYYDQLSPTESQRVSNMNALQLTNYINQMNARNMNRSNVSDRGSYNPYQEILDRKRMYESNPSDPNTQMWASESAGQFYNMLDPTESNKVSRMNANQLQQYINQRDRQTPTQIDFDRYRTEMATIEDLQEKWGFDYSREYAERIAEAQAQAKRDAANENLQRVDNSVTSAADALDRNYFLEGLQQAQAQTNAGLNAGIAADQDLRMAMARQAALGDVYARANEERYRLNNELGRIELERLAQEEQLYNERLQQAFENALGVSEFNQRDNLARLDAALQQRRQDIDMSQFLQDLDLRRDTLRGRTVSPEAQNYIDQIINSKRQWDAASTDAQRAQANRAAEQAREALARLGYDSSLLGADVTLSDALGNISRIGQTVDSRQLDEQRRQFDERLEEDRRQFDERLEEDRRQFDRPYTELTEYQKQQLAMEKYRFDRPYNELTAYEKEQVALERARQELAWAEFNRPYEQLTAYQADQIEQEILNRELELILAGGEDSNFNQGDKRGWIPNITDGRYRVSSPWGMRNHPISGQRRQHNGIDIAVPEGTELAATVPGTVVFAGRGTPGSGYNNYGNVVAIRDRDGHVHLYAHMQNVNVKKGQKVSRGQFIGTSGNTGRSTGAHLHYEVRNKGKLGDVLDPTKYLQFG